MKRAAGFAGGGFAGGCALRAHPVSPPADPCPFQLLLTGAGGSFRPPMFPGDPEAGPPGWQTAPQACFSPDRFSCTAGFGWQPAPGVWQLVDAMPAATWPALKAPRWWAALKRRWSAAALARRLRPAVELEARRSPKRPHALAATFPSWFVKRRGMGEQGTSGLPRVGSTGLSTGRITCTSSCARPENGGWVACGSWPKRIRPEPRRRQRAQSLC